MAYSLLCSHTDSDLAEYTPPPKLLGKTETYASCPGNLYSDGLREDALCFRSRELWPSCPGDVCARCQDSAVTIDNRCVCLCRSVDCHHQNLRFKHYFPFEDLCRPLLQLQGYRLLGNMYSTPTSDEKMGAEGQFRFHHDDSSSSDDDDTSSSETSSSSSSYSSMSTSSSSSSSSSSTDTQIEVTPGCS